MSVGKALAKNAVWQIGGKVLGTLIGLVTFFLIFKYFGDTGYGLFTAAITHVSIFAIIVDFGLTLTTTAMISEKGADEPKILGNLLTLRLISAALFMTLAPLTALFIPQSAGIMDIIVIASLNYFFGSIAQMFIGVFQKRLVILTAVMAETLNRLIAMVGIIISGMMGFGILGCAAAFMVGTLVQLIIILTATARKVHLRPQIDLSVWKEIVVRSWPIGVSIFFNLIYLKGDIFFMWIFDRSPAEIGQYGAAFKVVDVMTMIPVTFMGLLLPILSAAWSQKNKAHFLKHFQNGFDVMATIAVPFTFGSIVLGVPLMTALDPELQLAGQLLAVLGPAASILYFGSLYGHAIVAVNKQRIMTLGYAFVAAVSIAGYTMFIPEYGAWAAAWVTVVSELLIASLTFLVVTRAIGTGPNPAMFFRAFAASGIMTAAITFIPMPHVFLSILLGTIVYAASLVAFGGPKPQDMLRLFQPDKPPLAP